VSTGVSDRIGTVFNRVSMTMFIASPDCESRAKPTVAVYIEKQNRTDPARQCLVKIVFGDDETPRVPVSLVRIALQRFWN